MALTSDNVKKVQILATLDNEQHIMAVSEDKLLIKLIVQECKFVKLKDGAVGECSIKNLIDNDEPRSN